ncbi:MAG TPA: TlpA disulfide reductase family protein [Polyangiaceae bacterium]|nr:TlpA disulfide reductase family protein [Polyangiaceae bacterium]
MLLILGCAGRAPESPGVGTSLPEVPTVGLDRRPASLAGLTRGRVALVALWATWCTSCARELDELDRLQRQVGSGALVVGVAVGEPSGKVADYLRSRGLTYAQLVDEDFKLADALGTNRVPTTLVVGRNGTLRYAGGGLDRAALEELRRAIAEEAPRATAE